MLNKSRRFLLFIFILGFILFLGLVFSTWVIPTIIQPAADTAWLFLRMFILSVDQRYYWYLVAAAGTVWIIYRLTRRRPAVLPVEDTSDNTALSALHNWRELLVSSNQSESQKRVMSEKILQLLIYYYEVRQQSLTEFEIRQAIEQRQLPVPNSVYRFLYLPEIQTSHSSLWQIISHSLHQWHSRLTGQEADGFNLMIDELIEFINQ